MAAEQLHKSIEKRLSLAGGSAESGLIDSLLADVGAEPGDLALLEHALGLFSHKSPSACSSRAKSPGSAPTSASNESMRPDSALPPASERRFSILLCNCSAAIGGTRYKDRKI